MRSRTAESLVTVGILSLGSLGSIDSFAESPPQYVTQWGLSGSLAGDLSGPTGLAVDSNGNIYVTETGNSRVQKFASDGRSLLVWGESGQGDGQFQYPLGIDVDPQGFVYVADAYRVQKFTGNGVFMQSWGDPPCKMFRSDMLGCVDPDGTGPLELGDGQFDVPAGVAADGMGNIYVSDFFNCRIEVFTDAGVFLRKWGTRGSAQGQFIAPQGLDVGLNGNVYVPDRENHRIQEFTATGTYLREWGGRGSEDGQLYEPTWVWAGGGEAILVADYMNERIQVFDLEGAYLTKWGSRCHLKSGEGCVGGGQGQFSGPWGVGGDSEGLIYVADSNNDRIQAFSFNTPVRSLTWGNLKSKY